MAKQQRVKVTSAFRHRGEDIGIGSVLDLDLPIAQELRGAKKLEFAYPDTKLASVPLKAKERAPVQENRQVAELSAQVGVLTALVEKLTAQPAKAAPKEKVNA